MNQIKPFEKFLNENSTIDKFHVIPDIDLAIDDDLMETLVLWGENNIAVQFLNSDGLANVYGSKADLTEWVKDYYTTGDSEADQEFIDMIVPV